MLVIEYFLRAWYFIIAWGVLIILPGTIAQNVIRGRATRRGFLVFDALNAAIVYAAVTYYPSFVSALQTKTRHEETTQTAQPQPRPDAADHAGQRVDGSD